MSQQKTFSSMTFSAGPNQQLSSTQLLQSHEERLKEKAEKLKGKLIESRQKKEEELEKKVKDKLIREYQSGYEEFKKEIEGAAEGELGALQLVREFRISQICEFEQYVQQHLKKLSSNLQQLKQKQQELDQSFQQAVEFLNHEKDDEVRKVKQGLEKEKQVKVAQYENSIMIQ